MGKSLARLLRRRHQEGFSIVEVVILALLLLVAVGGLSGAVLSSMRLARTTEESLLADEAARALAGRLQTEEFSLLFRRYNAAPLDDPDGPSTAPGPAFDVPGLTPRAEDPDGRVGRIVFPVVDLPGGAQALHEDVVDVRLGMPAGRDLNGNDVIGEDASNDYVLLPARLIVEWTGAGGDRSCELDLVLVR